MNYQCQYHDQQVKNYLQGDQYNYPDEQGTSTYGTQSFDMIDEYEQESQQKNNQEQFGFGTCYSGRVDSKGMYSEMNQDQELLNYDFEQYSNSQTDSNCLIMNDDNKNIDGQYIFDNLANMTNSSFVGQTKVQSSTSQDTTHQVKCEEAQLPSENIIQHDKEFSIKEEESSQQDFTQSTSISTAKPTNSNNKKKPVQTINKKGQRSCEETKNLFVLSIPYLTSRLNGDGDDCERWEHASLIPSISQKKKLNSLEGFNKLLKKVEEISEQQEKPNILMSFRAKVNEILEHDYIKYANNQKDDKTQYIFLKYLQPIRMIAQHKSYTFSSVKHALKIFKEIINMNQSKRQ